MSKSDVSQQPTAEMSDEPKKPSQTPKPITPLRGTGGGTLSRTQPTTARAPDWSEWRLTPWVRVWQAAALSLDIDPHAMKQSPHSWMVGPGHGPIFLDESFPSNEIKEKFDKRLRVLSANFTNPEFFSLGLISGNAAGFCDVKLSEFAAWATSRSVGWEMPKELAALAQKAPHPTTEVEFPEKRDISAPAEVQAPPGVTWTREKRAKLREEHRTLKTSGHRSPTRELARKHGISEARIRELKQEEKAETGSNNSRPSRPRK